MAVLVKFLDTGTVAQTLEKLQFDSIMLQGVPEIAVACKRSWEELEYREQMKCEKPEYREHGKGDSGQVWSIVSTSQFALERRPRHSGAWDDKAVGDQLLNAFLIGILGMK